MSKRPRIKAQRAIITFADGKPGQISMKIAFKPCIENEPPQSPAVQAAMEMMQIFADRYGKGKA
ncbi:MAG TPA: hypothetical protein VK961_06885 [Chthoniobacter sp.]|nr:hypothetical protein [Chthoniobacter sp.]